MKAGKSKETRFRIVIRTLVPLVLLFGFLYTWADCCRRAKSRKRQPPRYRCCGGRQLQPRGTESRVGLFVSLVLGAWQVNLGSGQF